MRHRSGPLLLLILTFGTTGCSSGQETAAEDAARSFYQAVEARDGQAACGLLTSTTRQELEDSSGKPCPEAVLEEITAPAADLQAHAYGTMAQVRSSTDTAFLHRAQGRWLVLAARCVPTPRGPYDCQVKGN